MRRGRARSTASRTADDRGEVEVRGRDLTGRWRGAGEGGPADRGAIRAEWSGEFKQMEGAERRMAGVRGELVLHRGMLYVAVKTGTDPLVVLAERAGDGRRRWCGR